MWTYHKQKVVQIRPKKKDDFSSNCFIFFQVVHSKAQKKEESYLLFFCRYLNEKQKQVGTVPKKTNSFDIGKILCHFFKAWSGGDLCDTKKKRFNFLLIRRVFLLLMKNAKNYLPKDWISDL